MFTFKSRSKAREAIKAINSSVLLKSPMKVQEGWKIAFKGGTLSLNKSAN